VFTRRRVWARRRAAALRWRRAATVDAGPGREYGAAMTAEAQPVDDAALARRFGGRD